MRINYLIILFVAVFYNNIYCANEDSVGDIEMNIERTVRAETKSSNNSTDSIEIAERTKIKLEDVREVHQILSDDYKDNVKDLVRMRWIFRKAAGFTECFGNTCLHVGAGLATISTVMCLIDAGSLSNTISFAGTACIVTYVSLLGIARCCAREEKERDLLLKNLSKKVNFDFVSIQHTVVDGAEDADNFNPDNPLGGLSRV